MIKSSTEEVVKGDKSFFPPKLVRLRQKLGQKAKDEPKFRFYSLYGHMCQRHVLEVSLKLVLKGGSKAAGVDGVTPCSIRSNEHKAIQLIDEIELELKEQTYKPQSIRRVYIPKSNGKLRPLGIPTVKDRVVQRAAVLILEPIFETDFLDCSHGFRPGRKAHDAIQEVVNNIKDGQEAIYDVDLKGYFDTIPHDKLMACLQMRITDSSMLKLIRMWLKAPIIEPKSDKKSQGTVTRPKEGTPQGGVISPLLANIYLHWFDVVFHGKGGPKEKYDARLIRYCDDFVIMTRFHTAEIREFIRFKIEDWMNLEINLEKSKEQIINEEGQLASFLGYDMQYQRSRFSHSSRYLKVFPSNGAIKSAFASIRQLTDKRQSMTPITELIERLNRFLRGWQQYFSYGHDYDAYAKIDHYVYMRLIRHLRRRSQRPYKKPEDKSYRRHLEELGLRRLTG